MVAEALSWVAALEAKVDALTLALRAAAQDPGDDDAFTAAALAQARRREMRLVEDKP